VLDQEVTDARIVHLVKTIFEALRHSDEKLQVCSRRKKKAKKKKKKVMHGRQDA
jgi:hypothetical protein